MPPTATNPHHARRWAILGVLGIAQLMVVLDVTIVNIALPSAQKALAFSTVVTMVIACAVLLVARRSVDGFGDAVRSPPWMWLGGAMGVFIVFTITLVQPRFGTFATVAIFIVAQIAAGVAIDRFGWFGVERVGLAWTRVLGIVLLASGAVLALRR